MSWTVITLIICALLAVFTVWKEYQRPAKAYLLWRIVASIIAVIALACIILPVSHSKDIASPDKHSAILLTSGFNPDSLNNYRDSKLFTADKAVAKQYLKARLIRLDELKTDSPSFTKVDVFGYGLNENELNELGNLPVVFHPTQLPDGVSAINWTQKLRTGETLKIQGQYKNESTKPIKLILKGLNIQLDTATIAPKTNRDFELVTIPKNEGRVVYHLLVITGKDTLANESLPVEIEQISPLKILMLSASPDFETRFLKNWLSENGFSVAVRSAISKDKFSSEYVNIQPLKIDHLNAGLLDKFDLVIGDLSVLKSESALLKQEVIQKGLGIIIRDDSLSKGSSWLQNDFPVEHSNLKDGASVNLIIKNKKDRSAVLKTGQTFIRYQPGTQPLVNDMQGHLLVSSSLTEAGRLAFTTVNNTYNWVLAGDKDDYAAFWSLLIGNAAKRIPLTEDWSILPQFPLAGEPVKLQLQASQVAGGIIADNSMIAPVQNDMVPFEYGNSYWPLNSGWHFTQQKNGQPEWWYVYENNEWPVVRAFEKMAATRQYAETYPTDSFVTKQIHEKVQIAVPKIYFYLLLLAACTFLWVEGKGLTLPSPGERVSKKN